MDRHVALLKKRNISKYINGKKAMPNGKYTSIKKGYGEYRR